MNRRSLLALPLLIATRPALAEDVQTLDLAGSTAKVTMPGDADEKIRALVPRWIGKSADAVSRYYGRFPVPELRIDIALGPGGKVGGGRMIPGSPSPQVKVTAGRDTDEAGFLHDDWVMVHEMIHTALPWMGRRAGWFSEGVSVYVESVARVMAGHLTEADIWPSFVKMMPRGWPRPGEQGFMLDGGWARRYWGGAAFCLACDVEMLKRSAGRTGLRDALRGVNAVTDARGDMAVDAVLALGDKATGMTVLSDMARAMGETPADHDFAALWADLGVSAAGEGRIDDQAPLAGLRRAIFVA